MIPCECCGAEFTPKRSRQIYCSSRCSHRAARRRYKVRMNGGQVRRCLYCGREFSNHAGRYCSTRCGAHCIRRQRIPAEVDVTLGDGTVRRVAVVAEVVERHGQRHELPRPVW